MIRGAFLRMTIVDIVSAIVWAVLLSALALAGVTKPLPDWLVIAVGVPLLLGVYYALFRRL